MSDQELKNPRPLEYASPRDEPQVWTASRILGGVVIVPAGLIVGFITSAMSVGCVASGAMGPARTLFPLLLAVALAGMFGLLAHESKVLTRLFFIGATVGSAAVCTLICLTWRY